MIALIQRVQQAKVRINKAIKGEIGYGMLIFLGVAKTDTSADLHWLLKKVTQLRLFADAEGKTNLSICDIKAEIMVISQFTLLAKTAKGNRPSFVEAAPPEEAKRIYEEFILELQTKLNQPIPTGEFGAEMQVELTNDGPFTLWLDSNKGNRC